MRGGVPRDEPARLRVGVRVGSGSGGNGDGGVARGREWGRGRGSLQQHLQHPKQQLLQLLPLPLRPPTTWPHSFSGAACAQPSGAALAARGTPAAAPATAPPPGLHALLLRVTTGFALEAAGARTAASSAVELHGPAAIASDAAQHRNFETFQLPTALSAAMTSGDAAGGIPPWRPCCTRAPR